MTTPRSFVKTLICYTRGFTSDYTMSELKNPQAQLRCALSTMGRLKNAFCRTDKASSKPVSFPAPSLFFRSTRKRIVRGSPSLRTFEISVVNLNQRCVLSSDDAETLRSVECFLPVLTCVAKAIFILSVFLFRFRKKITDNY